MGPDFSHAANARILAYLKNPYDFYSSPEPGEIDRFRDMRDRDLAKIVASQSPDSVQKPYLALGTHPDLVARLWDEISAKLPRPCRWVAYGRPVLIHPERGIIFGWAEGTHIYALRLPVPERREALKAGAKTEAEYPFHKIRLDAAKIGEEWVLGHWIKQEVDWCLSAYQNAGNYQLEPEAGPKTS